MHGIENIMQGNLWVAWVTLIAAFAVLAKCADIFVDNSIALANRFKIPKLVVGIVLVSLATTAPELAVSLMSALRGEPQMALGNAIGSVICDDGLALALCGIMSAGPIPVMPNVLKTSGIFLISIEIIIFLFIVSDGTLNRWEGGVLVALFLCYLGFLFIQHKKGNNPPEESEENTITPEPNISVAKIITMFVLSLAGIIIASEFIIASAKTIALSFGMPTAVVAAVIVAFGTSIPEVATCITAARKKEGALAIGNIIGADIMNICWVAGASAIANDLTLSSKEIWFMFPWMFVIVGTMLFLLWRGHNLTRKKGFILLSLYILYIFNFLFVF